MREGGVEEGGEIGLEIIERRCGELWVGLGGAVWVLVSSGLKGRGTDVGAVR